jgi:hypothetical protein
VPRMKKQLLLSVILAALVVVVVSIWLFWPPGLAPSEVSVVGEWATPQQEDGFSTNLVLLPDRTCLVRWIDGAGNDTKAGHPPREGQWWIEDGTLFVDPSLTPAWRGVVEFINRKKRAKFAAWPLAIQDEALVLGPMTKTPVILRRQ